MSARHERPRSRRRVPPGCWPCCATHGLKAATAESCTGGLVAGALTAIAGSSDVVDRGFVTYSNEAKTEMLGVPAEPDRQPRRGERARGARHGRGRAGPLARRTSRWRSPASPGPAAAREQAGRAGPFRRSAPGRTDRASGAPLRRPRPADPAVARTCWSRWRDWHLRPRLRGSGSTADGCPSCRAGSAALVAGTVSGATPLHPSPAPLLEGLGELAEGLVEHRAHQQAERAAAELVGDVELDRCSRRCSSWKVQRFSRWRNGPSMYSTRIFSCRPVQRDAAGEGLADRLVADRHVGDEDLRALRRSARGGAPSGPRRAAGTAGTARRRRRGRTSRRANGAPAGCERKVGMDGRLSARAGRAGRP